TVTTERSWSLLRDLGGIRTQWVGRLDWVRTPSDGVLEVVDWKTSCRLIDTLALEADITVVMYARLARSLVQREVGWNGREVRFSHLYVAQGERVTVVITREMVAAAENALATLALGLRDN